MKAGGAARERKAGLDLYVFFVLALASFAVLFTSTRDIVPEFRNFGLTIFSGLRSGIFALSSGVSRSVLAVSELTTLRREYAELTAQIARYEQLERTAAEIRQENHRLRELLAFQQVLSFRHIPAELSGRDPSNLFSAFVINKGTRAGVEVDMPVVASRAGTQGLVGRVISTGAFESLVVPLYDGRSFVTARLTDSRYEGILEGRGTPEHPLLMRYIPRQARGEISIGEMVATSGMGGLYPPGINIGRISRISFRENELSMEVEVEPIVDFFRLEYVFVLQQNTEQSTEQDTQHYMVETDG
jgi:rod shape-determining protein MreC